jgi:hypothetical protein
MSVSDSLLFWFDAHIQSLPGIPLYEGTSFESSAYMLFEDLPFGVCEYKVPYRSIPFKRSGPKGWTYYPVDETGTRLARISFRSPKPGVYIRALVKLIDCKTCDGTDYCSVAEHAALTIDNLTSHGMIEMRNDPSNKRRKLCIQH